MSDKILYTDLFSDWLKEYQADLKKAIAETKKAQKTLQAAAKKQKDIIVSEKSLKAVTAALKKANAVIAQHNKLQTEEQRLNKQLVQSKTDQAKINERIRQQTNAQKRSTRELIQAEQTELNSIQALKQANRSYSRERDQLNLKTKQGKQRYDELTASMRRNEAQLKRFDKAIGRSQRNVGNYASAFRGLLGALGIAGGAMGLIQGLKSVTRLWIGFEKEMSKVRAITGATGKEFKKLRDLSLSLGKTTQFTASEVAQLEVEYAKLGFTTNQITAAAEATLDLALATGTDLANAATVTAGVLNSYNAKASDTVKFLDVMAKGFTSTALDIDKFKVAMANVGAAANASGFSIEHTTALLGTLVDSNIDASKAGTDLRTIFINLAKQGLTLDEALDLINNSQDKLTTSVGLFQKRASVSGIILANNIDKIQKLKIANENATGSLSEMATIMEDNVAGSLKELSSAWQGMIQSFSEGTGFVRGVTDALGDFFKWVNLNIDIQNSMGNVISKQTIKWSELRKEADKNGTAWRDEGKIQQETIKANIAALELQHEARLMAGGRDFVQEQIIELKKELKVLDEVLKVEEKIKKKTGSGEETTNKSPIETIIGSPDEASNTVDELLVIQKDLYDQGIIDLEEFEQRKFDIISQRLAVQLDDDAEQNEIADEVDLERLDEKSEEEIAKLRETEAAKQAIKQKSFQLANSLADLFVHLQNQRLQTEINDLNAQKAYELNLHGQTEESKEAINTKYDAKIKEAKKKKAKNEKAAGIFSAIISTAQAVAKANNNPYPLNFILMALSAALGAAQIIKIASTKVPEFAEGTEFVELGQNKKGKDTIHAMLNEGERVIDTDTNNQIGDISNKELPRYIDAGRMWLDNMGNLNIKPQDIKGFDSGEVRKMIEAQNQTNSYLRRMKFYDPQLDRIETLDGNIKKSV